ncbi:hypothetical protein A3C98_01580 [Candidatus Roizmanbacteria bacterium RIFCSPHIGHO2_02_FULL_37_15]|uniref:N-acetyltransferase domain-containing protein n=1 Tax=Candidatus Roizmanbacteria bacterium RIFCSPLOWO2_01_FULL_37_16 TaxID=1802058 RepID=A0A1F7IQK8_9BACT|nr:MAG: hypothetical protein A2859_00485 [Candidatus Roizmanbacteria bacterium RIFCSPHIGHO2_01_FULL_37_16b]OGK21161.1 MAG: hypothetical protein A3C98_01580 [Candidatus Roizmanbacteria bacterium RIFCSPHIGHO2_02_FULL_37_15]OGK32731.1 MAG: hypothetical protein A3F57_02015 [Candidatus Roizmanbacteria bacterium RIFCSPHIGHO2_12_FULL_36_11]OGK45639.1 MAG: hypothetical protein A3B40_00420 [Candidatus Roizmanbacteria bacterium RIFCSPLOWO2_01_FULL_37_16]OGK56628.1 MAG: hypothetical protein A3I50_01125 [C
MLYRSENIQIRKFESTFFEHPHIAETIVRNSIWQQIIACNPPILQDELLIQEAFRFVDIFNPERPDIASWDISEGVVDGEKRKAVIMYYYGRKEGRAGDYIRRVRYFPTGDPTIYLHALNRIANRSWNIFLPTLIKQEFRTVLPGPPFTEEELPDLLGSRWRLKKNTDPEKRNPQIVTRMGLLYGKRANLGHMAIPKGYNIRALDEGDKPQVDALLTYYAFNSFRDKSYERDTHLVAVDSNGVIVGLGGLIASANPVSIIGDLVTDPAHRDKDLAKAIVYQLLTEKIPEDSIVVADAINQTSISVFGKLGFKEYGKTFWTVHEKSW